MKRSLQGRYITISTVGEKVKAFVPAPLPPDPPVRSVHEAMILRPLSTPNSLVEATGLTPATANKCLEHLVRLGIVEEITKRRRDRLFCYTKCFDILNAE